MKQQKDVRVLGVRIKEVTIKRLDSLTRKLNLGARGAEAAIAMTRNRLINMAILDYLLAHEEK